MVCEIYHYVLYSVVLNFLCQASATRLLPFLPLEPPSLLDDFRRSLPYLPESNKNQIPLGLDRLGADVRLTDEPIQIEAGFYIRPRYNGRGLQLPPLLPLHVLPDGFNDLRRLEKGLFTPSNRRERPETPGQVKNYEDDLKAIEKERADELTTNGFLEEDAITSQPPLPSSFVNVGVTRGNNQEFKYNYSV